MPTLTVLGSTPNERAIWGRAVAMIVVSLAKS